MRSKHPEDGSAFAFGLRLLAAVAFTFALVAICGYLLLSGTLAHRALTGGQLHEARLVLALVGLLSPIGGATVFYLLGGRMLVREHRRALASATRDGLTDLPNRRAFEEEFPDAVAAARRYREPLALVLVEVDGLQEMVDRHGPQQGETTLRVLAGVLRSSRPSDRPYRLGGGCFAVLVAHTDADGARALTRRLVRNLAEAGVEASIGASALRSGMGPESLRAESETAVYEARRQGGNRVVHFDELQALASPRDVVMLTSGGTAAGETSG
jgi:diguanylate cyclase (GGDEF)-like protein